MKNNPVQHPTRTVTAFQTILNRLKDLIWNNLFTIFLCLNVPFFMFAHIYFLYHPEINKGGIFKYEYWSVFFASMMYPVLFFCFGYLWQRVANIYIHDKKGKKLSNILVGSFYFFSIFYFLITFFPYNNSYSRIGLNPFWYYIVAVVSTVLIVFVINYMPSTLKKNVWELKERIKSMQNTLRNYMDIIIKWEYRVDDPKEYRNDIYNKTKDSGLIK